MRTPTAAPSGYAGLLRLREYRGLLLSRVISLVGDQLARVALTVLVFQRTGSALLSAITYAVTFLPVVVAGPLLGGLADRLPRRRLLVAADLLRAALFAVMALPGMPLWALLVLVLLATTAEAPWAAARAPLMREVLKDDDGYQRGSGLDETLDQSGQIVGFAAAGALLVVLSPRAALVLDAATFLVSAAVVRFMLNEHPPADAGARAGRWAWASSTGTMLRDARTGLSAALAPACRRPLLLTWAAISCSIAPEALATPWASSLGAGPMGIGLLFAAGPAGSVIGLLLVARLPAARAQRLLVPLAVLTLLPLLACALDPPLEVALALVAVAGVGSAFSLVARVVFVREVVPAARGRAFSVAAAGVTAGQGVGVALAGVMATAVRPAHAVAATAAVGLLLVVAAVVGTAPPPPPRGRDTEPVGAAPPPLGAV